MLLMSANNKADDYISAVFFLFSVCYFIVYSLFVVVSVLYFVAYCVARTPVNLL